MPASQRLKVLLVEDSPQDAELLLSELARIGLDAEATRVETEAEFLAALDTPPDLILSDHALPQFDGITALELLRDRGLDTPFILISGTIGEEAAVQCLKRGADDYLLKDNLARLGPSITNLLEAKRLRDEKRQADEDRRRDEARTREAIETQAAILNALPDHIALVNEQGVIVTVNEAWRRFARSNDLQDPHSGVGMNYLEVCDRAGADCFNEAKAAAEGIRRALRGHAAEVCLEYPCHSPVEHRWFRLLVAPLQEGRTAGAVLTHINITERRLAEDQLRASEARFRAFMENCPAVAFIKDEEGRFLYTNSGWRRQIIPEPKEWLGRTDYDFWPRETADLFRQSDRHVLEKGEPIHTEETGVSLDGITRTWMVIKYPVPTDQGIGVGGMAWEVTDQRRAERALREHAALLDDAQRLGRMGIWKVDLRNRRITWSDSTCALFGISQDEFRGRFEDFINFVLPEDRPGLLASIRQAESTGSFEAEFRIRRPDGEVRWMYERGSTEVDSTGRPERRLGMIMDITRRKLAEVKLLEQAELLDKAQDAILVRDLDDRILYWNKSAERLYGWSEAEALGRPVKELLHQDDTQFQAATSTVLEAGEWIGEIQQETTFGRKIIVDGHWTLVRDDAGRPKSILTINTDITEKKKLEQQFLRAQRLESIGTLAGGIAHDLNNVLAPILISIELLQSDVASDAGREILRTIQKSAQHGADLVKQVLSFARGVEGARVLVNLRHLWRDLENVFADTFPKNIELEFNAPRELWPVSGDPTQLRQVFMNLCVNARDAMPQGGRLSVQLKNAVLDENYSAMNPDARVGSFVIAVVADTGMGIPPEIRDRIFDPFFTTKELGKGTGLGLSTVLAIVKSHGGFISVYSEPGKGTRFKIHLPAQTTRADAEDLAIEQSGLPRGQGELILVVDDEAAIRLVVKSTLERFGYKVLLAADGAEAVSVYARHQREIAVVLTDMAMPIMDGPTLIVTLKAIQPGVRIIASSGLISSGGASKALHSGARHFVPKPYTADNLLTVIRKILTEKPDQNEV